MLKNKLEAEAKNTMKKIGKIDKCGGDSLKIELFGKRYILLSTQYFPYEFMKDLEDTFGSVGEFFLYKGGKRVGKKLVKTYKEYITDPSLSMYDVMAAVGWYFGWAVGKAIKEGENYRMILYDSFEADSYIENEGIGDKPVCHFLRGVLTGIVEEIENEEFVGEEIKCKAEGYEYCEFIIKKKS